MKTTKFCRRFVLLLLCNGFAILGFAVPQAASHSVTLSWTPATQPANIAAVSWNVYRSPVSSGPYTMIASLPVASVSYVDSAVVAGDEYFYVVTCVDTAGMESTYSAIVDATIPVGDFQGTIDSPYASVNAGGQATYILNLTASGGFIGSVTLSASGLPPLATESFSPPVVPGGSGTSILTVTTPSTLLPGDYPFTITGTSGTLAHWTTVDFLVGTVDFMGSVYPTTQSVLASTGGNVQFAISLIDMGTRPFGNSVTFSISGLPAGVTASFLPTAVIPGSNGTSALYLSVPATTRPGIYTLLVTGTGGGVTHATNVNLIVVP